MTIMSEPLGGSDWQIVFDVVGKKLFIEHTGTKLSVNDFLGQEQADEARKALTLLIVDWFPNEDHDNGELAGKVKPVK